MLDPWEREPGQRVWTCRRCNETVGAYVELCKRHERERLDEKDRQRAHDEYEEWRRKTGDVFGGFP